MTQEIRPPTPSPEPTPQRPQVQAPVQNLRQRVGDAVQEHMAGTTAKPAQAVEQNPNSPAGRLRRLYDVWSMPVGFSLHFKSDGYMDLVIEKLRENRISMTHYGEQNGDLMKDPDVEVLLLPDGTIRGVAYQNDYAGFYHTCEDDPPTARLARSLQDFLATWLRELHAQGFATPSPAEAQRRDDALAAFLRENE